MKLNKTNLFILIWVAHIIIYHTTYSSVLVIASGSHGKWGNILGAFLVGLLGVLEQIPFFFIIPIVIMLIFIKTKWGIKKWFISFVSSVTFSYLINYLWILSNRKHLMPLYDADLKINIIYPIVISLIITIITNYVIFRNKYKQLGV